MQLSRVCLSLLASLFAAGALVAQPQKEEDYDPFADSNKATAKPVTPKPPVEPGATSKRILFALDFPKTARPGEVVKLTITGTPQGQHYTYPLTRRTPEELPSMLCKLTIAGQGLSPLMPVTESESQIKKSLSDGKVEFYWVHKKPFTWSQDVLVQANGGPGRLTLKATIRYIACDETSCDPPAEQTLESSIDVSGEPVTTPAEVLARANEKPRIEVIPAPDATPRSTANDPVAVKFELSTNKVRPGQVITVKVTATPKDGIRVFPIAQRAPNQPATELSTAEFLKTGTLFPLYKPTESNAGFEKLADGKVFLVHNKPFTWSQDVLVGVGAEAGKHSLVLDLKLRMATGSNNTQDSRLDEIITVEGSAVPLTPEMTKRLNTPFTPKINNRAPESLTGEGIDEEGSGLLAYLVIAATGAFLMLLTPCVFPMIPITVSFFLKQSEKEHHRPLATASVYSGTIIIILTAAVFVLGERIIRWANDVWFNLVMGAVLVYFALSLFGMYEIELPSFLSRFTAARESQGGYSGAVFMALTFTITSFTCTGPFLGLILVGTAQLKLTAFEVFLGALVYSATFAAPFFVLALFPSLLRKLPKSGGWMNNIKVVFGFLEIAAALKFLAVTDAGLNPGNPALFNYDTVLCAWIALSGLCGLYLLGIFRLPHDSPVEHIGVVRMLFAGVFVGLALYMTPLLKRETPLGPLGRGMQAFLPLDSRLKKEPVVATSVTGDTPNGAAPGPAAPGPAAPEQEKWYRDLEEAWKIAVEKDKLIFIDFTGTNCQNCRLNEQNAFPNPAVHKELTKYVLVQLYTDNVPDATLSSSESLAQGKRNSGWQRSTFDDLTNPFYVVLEPDPTGAVENGKLKGRELGRRKGLIEDVPEFARFLAKFQGK